MIKFFLDFENEIAQIESRINELRHLSTGKTVIILDEITVALKTIGYARG